MQLEPGSYKDYLEQTAPIRAYDEAVVALPVSGQKIIVRDDGTVSFYDFGERIAVARFTMPTDSKRVLSRLLDKVCGA